MKQTDSTPLDKYQGPGDDVDFILFPLLIAYHQDFEGSFALCFPVSVFHNQQTQLYSQEDSGKLYHSLISPL